MAEGGSIGQKSVVLILARELASNVATPMLLLDHRGVLVFFNEPAGVVFGTHFDDVGEIPPEQWDAKWPVTDAEGERISLPNSALANVILHHTPGHQNIRVQGLDGIIRPVAATVFPLFDSGRKFVGAMGVFWQSDNGHGPAGMDPAGER